MAFNRHSMQGLLHILLVWGLALASAWFAAGRQQYATAAFFAFLMILAGLRLFYLYDRTNRVLARFLEYMRDNDPSIEFSGRFVRKNFGSLERELGMVVAEVRDKRIEGEFQARYLQTVIDHMESGVMIADSMGKIQTMNRKAVKYLGREPAFLHDLDRVADGMGKNITALKPGQSLLQKVLTPSSFNALSVKKAYMAVKGEQVQIISLTDIRPELEDQELESWKKLIRIITHEIMNSITPINTLTAALRKKLGRKTGRNGELILSGKDLSRGMESLDIIEERTLGVTHFIERCRTLTRLPEPRMEEIRVDGLFGRLEFLFREQLESRNINLIAEADDNCLLKADPGLMEQVMINLVKNSMEALQGSAGPWIRLSAKADPGGHTIIEVADNGCGITEKDMDQVFVPFYSTKPGGSGIGLSFSKQVLRMHRARMSVTSAAGKGCVFRMVF